MFRYACVLLLLVLKGGSGETMDSSLASSAAAPSTHSTLAPTTQQHQTTTAPTTTQSNNATTAEPTTQATDATTESTNATTVAPTTESTNATTVAPTTESTNATTVAPTTESTNATTAAPTTQSTNATTAAPTTQSTNATTVAPTNTTIVPTPGPTTPTPSPNPATGDYVLKSNSTACLMATMGVQFSYKLSANSSFQTINLDPNATASSGTCGNDSKDATLLLKSDKITVQFIFTTVSSKFSLHALNVTVDSSGVIFSAANTNLSLWQASVGSSYMCKKEQSYNITNTLTLNTFMLQVQPFGVANEKFSTAEECGADDTDNFTVPIAVGVSLVVLIVIVLLAYAIGRKRSHSTGYQSFN